MARVPTALIFSATLVSCSPYYTALPKALTYEMEEIGSPAAPMPDPVAIATGELGMIVASGDPKDVAVGPPRRGKFGWGFCLSAAVTNSGGASTRMVLWVTDFGRGIYGRRQAEPDDQCAFDRYTPVIAKK